MGEKGGMQLNKAEVIALVVYVQLWAQRFVFWCFGFGFHNSNTNSSVDY